MTEALFYYGLVAVFMARATYDKDHAAEVWFFSLLWPLLLVICVGQLVFYGAAFSICLPFRVIASFRPVVTPLEKPKTKPTIGVTKF